MIYISSFINTKFSDILGSSQIILYLLMTFTYLLGSSSLAGIVYIFVAHIGFSPTKKTLLCGILLSERNEYLSSILSFGHGLNTYTISIYYELELKPVVKLLVSRILFPASDDTEKVATYSVSSAKLLVGVNV